MDATAARRLGTLVSVLAALVALALLAAPAARACSCAGYDFDEAIESADLIGEATVQQVLSEESDGSVSYLLVVDRVWKGEASRTIVLTTNQDTVSCGLGRFPVGAERQFWIRGSEGRYSGSWCDLPMDGEGDDSVRLTELLGEPTDLTPLPVELPSPEPSLSPSTWSVPRLAGLALALGAGAMGLRVVGLTSALVLIARRR